MTKTVPMFRPDDGKMADVHPAEVENMRATGWRVTERQGAPDSGESPAPVSDAPEGDSPAPARAQAPRRGRPRPGKARN